MPLNYDPQHAIGWMPKAGTYSFVISACAETQFSTGSHGVRVHLQVDAGGPTKVAVRDNIVFGDRSTWKMRDLCLATGVRFDPPCEASDLEGKSGTASFVVDSRDGYVDLKVVRYKPLGGSGDRDQHEDPRSGSGSSSGADR